MAISKDVHNSEGMLGSVIVSTDAKSGASEDALLAAARDGDVEAFGRIFERYKDLVFSFVMKSVRCREDAEDIVQETFYRAWRSISRFRGDSKLMSWLCRIAANLCIDLARSASNRVRNEADMDAHIQDFISNRLWQDVEQRGITKSLIDEALGRLHVTHRMLLVLCDIEGFSHAEAASIVGGSPLSVRIRLFRARKKLRSMLAPILREG